VCEVYPKNYLRFISFIILSVRLSALEFCNEITAQIAAGIHPISVICKIKQITPVNILPRRKNERNGKKIAMRVIIDIVIYYNYKNSEHPL
jgi:hypothetical protein